MQALATPSRVRILGRLRESACSVGELAEAIGMEQSAVSHQLRLLRSMRLVRSRRDGRHIYYTVDDDHIATLFAHGLDHVQERTATGRRAAPDRRPANRRREVSRPAAAARRG